MFHHIHINKLISHSLFETNLFHKTDFKGNEENPEIRKWHGGNSVVNSILLDFCHLHKACWFTGFLKIITTTWWDVSGPLSGLQAFQSSTADATPLTSVNPTAYSYIDKAHSLVRSSPLIRWLVFRACPQTPEPGGRGRGRGWQTGTYLINPRAAAIGRRTLGGRPSHRPR